ncbi:MAG TPA: DsbC family protein [Geomonas sp.]|nr:DsbC family protein [Geomonas sp.]
MRSVVCLLCLFFWCLPLFPGCALAEAPSYAALSTGGEPASCGEEPAESLTVAEANTLLKGLGVQVKEVKKAPIRGMWELTMERGGERSVAYLDHDRKYLVPGPVFDIANRTLATAAGSASRPAATVAPASIPLADSLVMGNPEGTKRLFVFTDPDCPFCARLHWELVKLSYLEPDLAIYLKMFPLKMHPQAFDKARVILGRHSLKLLETAFVGGQLPPAGPADPSGPVEETLQVGERIGISSTPTVVLPDGRIAPGVKSAAELKRLIDW